MGTLANWVLLASLLGGVLSTFVIVKTADVKETHWDKDREAARERFSELATEAEHARAEFGKANAEIAKANATIAKAEERAAELGKEASLARLEQEKLKAQLAWRRLEALETRAFVQNIAGKIEKIILFNLSPDPETVSYMVDLNSAFTRAGVKVDARSGMTGPYFGIGLEGGSEQERAIVIDAFAAAKVIVRPEAPFGELTLIVGSKPPPP